MNESDYREQVYGPQARLYPTYKARPLKAVVRVDAEIPGCPIDAGEFALVVKDLLLGKAPSIPDYPVCVECKKVGNVCRYELGKPCLGIVTRAGCKACCVTEGAQCWGCRGLFPSANLDAARTVMDSFGFDRRRVQDLLRMFLGDSHAPL
jgi:coenzyme F420-reducing hydrogenase gamma subunit